MKAVLVGRLVRTVDRRGSTADWVAFEEGVITAVGRGDPPRGHRTVRTEGVVLPGMIDAHLHLVTTGLYSTGLDFRECRSVEALLEELRKFLGADDSQWLVGGNFDPGRNPDARMPERRELDAISGNRVLLISRADGHSCTLSSAALAQLGLDPGLEGFGVDERGEATGVLSNQANYQARARFFSQLPETEIRRALRAACELALSRGVTSVHEMGFGGEQSTDLLLEERGNLPIDVRPYVATFDVGAVVSRGLTTIGGDLFLDGSLGSRTAALGASYSDGEGSGTLYHSDEAVTGFFLEASRAGLQAGVHAIGDAAIEQAIRCLEAAFVALGPEGAVGARRLRHRIEHFECVSFDQVERAARLGVVPSVQPAFDRYWGGIDGMYASRLGERATTMNPFPVMIRAGMTPAGGSDSSVTPLDPFLGMAAAVDHHEPAFAVTREHALRMFTSWAAAAGHSEDLRGTIQAGKRADFCVLEDDPLECDVGKIATLRVLQTWVGGKRAWNSS